MGARFKKASKFDNFNPKIFIFQKFLQIPATPCEKITSYGFYGGPKIISVRVLLRFLIQEKKNPESTLRAVKIRFLRGKNHRDNCKKMVWKSQNFRNGSSEIFFSKR